jgi:hypothetical protein
MTSTLQIVDADLTTVLFDLYDPTAANSTEYGSVQTYMLHNPSWGVPTQTFDRFKAPGHPVGRTTFADADLTTCAIPIRIKASSYDNLTKAVGRLSQLLSSGCVIKWVPDGSTDAARYADIEPTDAPAIIDGRPQALYEVLRLFDTPKGVTLALVRQPWFRGAALSPALNVLANPTMTRDSNDDGLPDSWVWDSFDPTAISGLKLWLKADALALANNDPVASWTDSSGNSNHAAQATSGLRPLFKTSIQNGRPVVRFDATDDLLESGNFMAGTSALTVIAVASKTTANNTGLVLAAKHGTFGAADGEWVFRLSEDAGGGDQVQLSGNQAVAGFLNAYVTSTSVFPAFMIASLVWAGSTEPVFRDNGAALATASSGWDTIATMPTSSHTVKVGHVDGFNVPSGGDIAELLVLDSALSAANHNLIGNYLASKWGLTWTTVT